MGTGAIEEELSKQSTAGKVISCKAAITWTLGDKVSIEQVDVSPPKAGEVRIRITHTAICQSDLIFMKAPTMQALLPRILGHESAGIVESVGEGVTDLQPGDHVLPLFTGECMECVQCKSNKSNICEIYNVDGMRGTMLGDNTTRFSQNGKPIHHGFSSTFSEYTVVERPFVVKINPAAPLEKVCLLSCGAATGMGSSLKECPVEAGATVAIFGLGCVGLGIAEGARVSGASRIIGVDINDQKDAFSRKFGITDFLNPTKLDKPVEQVIQEMTNGGVNYSFESVGNPKVMRSAFDSCHVGMGTCVIAGVLPRGITMELEPAKLIRSVRLLGTNYGGYKAQTDIPGLVEKYLKKEIELDKFITHNLPFSEINQGIQLLKNGESLRTVLHY